ncbi:hypothetical protein TanjilG_12030 [Lupinus angustifolius]|uniref:Uncharacterized protein n=1 Tax=Lupinus angustifolius TaxID=3871 RepID=A0A1J7GXW1_LUPAN|nr:hypothetical protein TanjilG_12030 [Lupinus angustifolius]
MGIAASTMTARTEGEPPLNIVIASPLNLNWNLLLSHKLHMWLSSNVVASELLFR